MSEENREGSLVPVVIMGQTYKVRAEENEAYIEELARFVDTKISTIAGATGTGESLKVAILAALNIADELFKAEEQARDRDGELQERIGEIASELEDALRDPVQTAPG